MMDFIQQGGVMMYPLILIALVVVGLGVWATVRVPRVTGPDPVVEMGIDATLFWGGWALLLGLLGTFVGVYFAAGAISQAGGASAALVWGGIQVALTTTVFGLGVFSLAALAWFVLRTWYRRAAMG